MWKPAAHLTLDVLDLAHQLHFPLPQSSQLVHLIVGEIRGIESARHCVAITACNSVQYLLDENN